MNTLRNILQTSELRNKILFTLFVVVIYRLGVQIPAPGVSLDAIESLRAQADQTTGGIFGYLNLFSGGGLRQLSLFSLGVLPYITASIIIQILTVAIPKLEQWQSQGAVGQRKINQWTRYVAIVLAIVQATGIVFMIGRNPEAFFGVDVGLFPVWNFGRVVLAVTCMVVGTAVVMWLGELITQKGIGNGMSLIIMASVVSNMPELGFRIHAVRGWLWVVFAFVLLAVLVAGIVFV
ncbi:MAG: preprotein translocase subunit SecY, partial [Acidimicrobiia bacterium]|nr:preprotein translocase subunit SecY [Acidimicrobiia bacterium]